MIISSADPGERASYSLLDSIDGSAQNPPIDPTGILQAVGCKIGPSFP